MDLAMGLAAGYLATKVMDRARYAPQQATPPAAPNDKEASARSLVQLVGVRVGMEPDTPELGLLGRVVHEGFGMGWGSLYGLLRRHSGMSPLGAGLCIGSAILLVIDGAVHPALGIASPLRIHPPAKHARRLAGRLIYGLTIAVVAEGLHRVRRPARVRDD
jgi:uncharacterized membrane protein YagU involved in acid resistance